MKRTEEQANSRQKSIANNRQDKSIANNRQDKSIANSRQKSTANGRQKSIANNRQDKNRANSRQKSTANGRQKSIANNRQDKNRANGRQSNRRTATEEKRSTRISTIQMQQSSQPVPKHPRTDADVQQGQGEVITAQKQQHRQSRRS